MFCGEGRNLKDQHLVPDRTDITLDWHPATSPSVPNNLDPD